MDNSFKNYEKDYPIVFISYSWDSSSHKEWVLNLAKKLIDKGIDVILDQFDLRAGKNMIHFMESSIPKADKVLIIFTPNYKLKAENRQGGVGFEYSILNAELYDQITTNIKFIPVLKDGNFSQSIPSFIQQFISVDMTEPASFEKKINELVYAIYNKPLIDKPKRGENPFLIEKLANVNKDQEFALSAAITNEWKLSYVKGSSAKVYTGYVGTLKDLNGHHRECFTSDGTIILGTLDSSLMKKISANHTSWEIPVEPFFYTNYIRGFLAIGCLRFYGGLHSRKYDSRAVISVNGKAIDRILLRIKPDGHSDYFCHLPKPHLCPNISPFAECSTLYVWPLIKENLLDSKPQSVDVELDRFANWDIDYIGIIAQLIQ